MAGGERSAGLGWRASASLLIGLSHLLSLPILCSGFSPSLPSPGWTGRGIRECSGVTGGIHSNMMPMGGGDPPVMGRVPLGDQGKLFQPVASLTRRKQIPDPLTFSLSTLERNFIVSPFLLSIVRPSHHPGVADFPPVARYGNIRDGHRNNCMGGR